MTPDNAAPPNVNPTWSPSFRMYQSFQNQTINIPEHHLLLLFLFLLLRLLQRQNCSSF
jgi:hypothetical protein